MCHVIKLIFRGDFVDKKPNRLIKEKSPYLLQHAYNPVDWYPWGDEALTSLYNRQGRTASFIIAKELLPNFCGI